MSSQATPEPARPADQDGTRTLVVRRAPRFAPFLITGALLGVIAAAIIALTGAESSEFTRGAVFGFFAMILAIPGLLLGGLAVLLADRASINKARRIQAEPTGEESGPGQ